MEWLVAQSSFASNSPRLPSREASLPALPNPHHCVGTRALQLWCLEHREGKLGAFRSPNRHRQTMRWFPLRPFLFPLTSTHGPSRRLPILVLALEGATSYGASAVANPPGHMSMARSAPGWRLGAPVTMCRCTQRKQRVRVSVDLIAADPFPGGDRRRIIKYEKIVAGIREVAGAGHNHLCEGLAERVCTAALPTRASRRFGVGRKARCLPRCRRGRRHPRAGDRLAPHPDERGSTRRDGPPHGERLAGLGDIVDPQNLNALLNRG